MRRLPTSAVLGANSQRGLSNDSPALLSRFRSTLGGIFRGQTTLLNGAQSRLMRPGLIAMFALLVCSAGCVRRAGRNSECRWPAETIERPADARHLSADSEFAEDLAIRYADTHHGLRTPHFVSGEAYDAARDRCLETLFEEIAKTHGVATGAVSNSLGRHRAGIDLAMILPITLLYCFGAAKMARTLWRRYPPAENGWIPGTAMILFVSLVFAVGSMMLGEIWCWNVETLRIGNDHMSYRAQRLWWGRHRTELFAGCAVVFWLTAARAAHRMRSKHSLPADRALQTNSRIGIEPKA